MMRMSPKKIHIRKFENCISMTTMPLKKMSRLSLKEVKFTRVLNMVLCSATALATIQTGTSMLAKE